ncbi:MAG: FumA C-terminus/TtdB family hydratase beta subunit [Candidatus Omnitrophica bacterium]|nr:FumA C-terminus/TtdB family hydratase beta subunit [Candidatus Omnitrophota bacterium]
MRRAKGKIGAKDIGALLTLRAGEEILFSGYLYTARDQAHKRIVELIKKNKKLPFDLSNQIIYYCGPTETPEGKIIGSCGPTTSSRMDRFVEPLLKAGVAAMIGKGRRSKSVRDLIKKHKSVYFAAPAGCGALLAKKVLSREIVCFKELGPEAVYRLKVRDFPLVVAIDSRGNDLYKHLEK